MKFDDEVIAVRQSLDAALRRFDWPEAERVVAGAAELFRREPNSVQVLHAAKLLAQLRRKRRFSSMSKLVDALPLTVANDWTVRRQRAQSLIEQGEFPKAEDILVQITEECPKEHGEYSEAKGLLGRIYKQRYVNENRTGGPYRSTRPFLARAIEEYTAPWLLNPSANVWHGINLVACIHCGLRDNMGIETRFDPQAIAREILRGLESREQANRDLDLGAWWHATALECLVALVKMEAPEAVLTSEKLRARSMAYVLADGADAFEINSTLRQLVEVWHLTEAKPPGADVLPVLRAALLTRVGGSLELAAGEANAALEAAPQLDAKFNENIELPGRRKNEEDAGKDLERKFRGGGFLGLNGWKMGLERSFGVARIETRDGLGFGTGWLVDAATFFPGSTGTLLLSNSHVLSDARWMKSLPPRHAVARFPDCDPVDIVGEVMSSHPDELDFTFVRLRTTPRQARTIPTSESPVEVEVPPQFLYIIGYPGGGNQAFSLNDNVFLARNEKKLHYRTPTEKGSSGSPVFDPITWEAIALHHAGASEMDSLNGAGTYEANEGICLCAVRQSTTKSGITIA